MCALGDITIRVFLFPGAVFSAVASLETLCNFVGTFIFNSLYPASLKHNFPGLVFFLGALIVVIPFVLVW